MSTGNMYKKISGTATVTLSFENIALLNELVEKNEPLPVTEHKFEYEGEQYTTLGCPRCKKIVSKGDGYCRRCGQRVDTENIAL